MNWLFETKTSVVVLLGMVVAIAVGLWWTRSRNRRGLAGVGAAVLLLALYLLLGLVVETEEESAQQALEQMRDAYNEGDLDAVFERVSEDFNFKGMNKEALRGWVETARDGYNVKEVVIWDIKVEDFDKEQGSAKLGFHGKAKGRREYLFDGQATFVREADQKWRMTSFKVFWPGKKDEVPYPK